MYCFVIDILEKVDSLIVIIYLLEHIWEDVISSISPV